MGQSSAPSTVDLFKECYGNLQEILPTDYPLQQAIPFEEKQKVGEKFVEAVTLSHENGWTLAGSGNDLVDILPAVAGAVKQAEVNAYATILPSVIPWQVISRSAGGGKKAFFDATKHVVKNNLKSHGKLQEILRLYGQSSELLGYVSYATATYRTVSFTNGGGTLSINGTNVTFTGGVNTTSKWILFAPGQFAAGIWVGSEGMIVQQINNDGAVVGEGAITGYDCDKGAIQVDFVPTAAGAATGANSYRIALKKQNESMDMVGIHKIMSTSGNLFGINNTNYNLYRGNVYPVTGKDRKSVV